MTTNIINNLEKEVLPTNGEVSCWLTETLKHSHQVEYFMSRFGLDSYKTERPHDLSGKNNKFQWDVLRGFAFQYRGSLSGLENQIKISLDKHREQIHHKLWVFSCSDKNSLLEVKEEDMIIGAIDSICSLREKRIYNGRSYGYDEIPFLNSFLPHQIDWIKKVVPIMMKMEQPKWNSEEPLINNLPHEGLNPEIYEESLFLLGNIINFLTEEKGYNFL